jgi:hypothetical protein
VLNLEVSSGIVAGLTYQMAVSAYNAVGEGPLSDNLHILAARVPFAPQNVIMISQSATSIVIAWDTPDNGGSPILTYKVFSDLATNGLTYAEIVASTGLVN